MKINNKNLFIGIILFLIVIDLLIVLGLNQFYVRTILAFLFLTIAPGLLLMLCFKIREIGFWEYLVYIVGLSVAFVMFIGFAINWLLPLVNITDKPLSLWPILLSFNLALIIMANIAYRRNRDLEFKVKFLQLNTADNIFFIVPMLFPLMAVVGAFILNNNGSNILTMILLGAIAIYVLFIILFRQRLNENVYPWSIWLIGLSVLLSSSLRSWYVSGADTNLEYMIFQLTSDMGHWSLENFHHVYNAMLSVNIFPTFISHIINVGSHNLFKIFMPLIFAITPVILFLFVKKNFGIVIGFLSAFFFISQEVFLRWAAIPIRQELAFLFFSLLIMAIFAKNINKNISKALIIIFSFSMTVSHYSTTYIGLSVILLAMIANSVYNKLLNKGSLEIEKEKRINAAVMLLLFLFTFLWYSQLTDTTDGLSIFLKKSVSNIDDIFREDTQAEGRSLLEQFNVLYKVKDRAPLLNEYINETYKQYNDSAPDRYQNYEEFKTRVNYPKVISKNVDSTITSKVYLFGEIIKKSVKLFLIIGIISLLISLMRKKSDKKENYFVMLNLAAFLALTLIFILPYASITYDLVRTSQQMLFIMAPCTIVGASIIFSLIRLKENHRRIIITVILIAYFIFVSSFLGQILGSAEASTRLNNFGTEYNLYYTHKAELTAGNWLLKNNKPIIYVDSYANTRLDLLRNKNRNVIIVKDLLPNTVIRNAYVYSGYSNVVSNLAFKPFGGNLISYNYPSDFLSNKKNKVYNDGGAEVFK